MRIPQTTVIYEDHDGMKAVEVHETTEIDTLLIRRVVGGRWREEKWTLHDLLAFQAAVALRQLNQ